MLSYASRQDSLVTALLLIWLLFEVLDSVQTHSCVLLFSWACWDCRRAHGYRFNHAAFVASFRSAKTRTFLEQLRQSQCYEVFFNDRLLVASSGQPFADHFEASTSRQPSRFMLLPQFKGGKWWMGACISDPQVALSTPCLISVWFFLPLESLGQCSDGAVAPTYLRGAT